MTTEKAAARRAARERRLEAHRRHGVRAATGLAEKGLSFLAPAPGAIVSGFASINDEIDCMPLLARVHAEGHTLCLPVMQGKGKPLLFRRWAPGDPMGEAVWGISEPLPSAPVLDPDIVLVPLLAFDAEGGRLGQGGGYYDRTLAALRGDGPVTAIGVGYALQERAQLPIAKNDQRLDWILTEDAMRQVGS